MSSGPLVTVDAAALRNNLAVVRRFAPGARVIAAVKANAYGHGLVHAARALADADAFGVARVEEGLILRAAHVAHPIVVLEGAFDPAQLDAAASHRLQLVVHSFEQIAMLEQYAGAQRFAIWLKLDTGMNRLGFRPEELASAHQRLAACTAVATMRLLTHLACAENVGSAETQLQLDRFRELSAPLHVERSIANSAGIIAWPAAHAEWVRPGLMLYGASPFAERSAADLGLLPAMTFTTQLVAVRNVAAGEAIGYNGIWRAQRRSRIGVAAVGYGDGYPRCMRAGAPALVDGREAPVVGRISMDMTMLDVTDLPDAAVGDEVTLWGRGLPAERVAQFADTIAYELFCRIAERVRREEVSG
ncbi:MAG TPA: alanine racemase [Steroidobacteraceae bacterium]|nr:alanine racemase [Steroidobacteraceae bacterium]